MRSYDLHYGRRPTIRVEYIIPPDALAQGVHEFVIESSCNGMFSIPWNGDTIAPPDMNRYFSLASADLVVPNMDAWGLLWDFQTLTELVDTLPGTTPLQNKALTAANAIMNASNKGDPSSIRQARKIAEGVFGAGWENKGADVYKEGGKKSNVWGKYWAPYSVTQQKVARSWATQVDLMERYPEHRFACSSAQQYKWVEELYPPLFERVKAKILSGQFQPNGGPRAENDANMPSGEVLIRQFLFGQRYFESRFGKRCETVWLPDSFGLTGGLPQIIWGSGIKYFFTQKLSWNGINTFPHSTFNWVGIDGTQVLCHMTPVDTYTAQATVGDVNKGLTNHKNLESSDTSLLVFGNGDGGGGPLAKMLENLGLTSMLPPVNMGHSVDEFFEHLEGDCQEGGKLPNWYEICMGYFHRGTYTSHGSIKKGNMHSEILLRDVEHIATLASLYRLQKQDYVYPKEEIDECWEKVLLNQFLPGSAISNWLFSGMVYNDAEKLYAEIKKQALDSGSKIVGYNTTPFPRWDIIKIPLSGANAGLKSQVMQASDDMREGYAIMESSPCGPRELRKPSNELHARLLPVSADAFEGGITSLIDVKLKRELIPEGATGGLIIFGDCPNYWDAWGECIMRMLKYIASKLRSLLRSPMCRSYLHAAVKAQIKHGQSTFGSTAGEILVDGDGSRSLFNFDAVVDWHQRHEFLKCMSRIHTRAPHVYTTLVEIPLVIHNDNATYETQSGYVQRPTHKNTTWDIAKFEICEHKYTDLSEFGYGVAILSESKYGFSCIGNMLRISLLRSATAPDAEQDQGKCSLGWGTIGYSLNHMVVGRGKYERGTLMWKMFSQEPQ
ncbi:glycosyl hydrolases family 38 N-terminal domain-containing protein [Cyathus striatus]|nr:glycosyl hydrolases family 38 N-terminal domain-containing protein [Cyathus striatus]